MLPIIVVLQIIYQFVTRKIYADLIESLDMYEITQEREKLIQIALNDHLNN